MQLTPSQVQMIENWQRHFPLTPEPFARIGKILGIAEHEVIHNLRDLKNRGILSRVGATVRPNTAGASTLAALSAPKQNLEVIADIINEEPGVNHNYEREHDLNLWFVVTGKDKFGVQNTLNRIEQRTGCPVLDLPLVRPYHIDLGFSVFGSSKKKIPEKLCFSKVPPVDEKDKQLLIAIEDGLPKESRPYKSIGERLNISEKDVISQLSSLIWRNIVTRFGLIIRHRELGYKANAMAVWDVEEDEVDRIGRQFAAQNFVTLCYQRPRRQPVWPYNLFCMVHGKERTTVLDQIEQLQRSVDGGIRQKVVLFSKRRFKQRGAKLSAA